MQNTAADKELKKWLGVSLYVVFIFVTSPILPVKIKQLAQWLGISLPQMVHYLKIGTLTILTIAITAYLYISKRYKDKTSWGIILLIAVVGKLLLANFGSPADTTHLLEYGILSIFVFYTLAKEKPKPLPYKLYYQSALITSLIGVADEIYQGYLPNRYYDPNDILTNAVSGILGLLFIWGVVRPNQTVTDMKRQ